MSFVREVFLSFFQGIYQTVVWLIGVPTQLLWRCLLWPFPDGREIDAKICLCERETDETKVIDAIYRFLGVLDAKAAALMQYNGIILAVVAIMAQTKEAPLPAFTYWIGYATLGSILACLSVVGVFWRFLEFVKPEASGLSDELDVIRRVLVMRECAYQLAWWLAVVAGVFLLADFGDIMKHIHHDQPDQHPGVGNHALVQ